MAKFTVGAGIDKYIDQLVNLEFEAHGTAGKMVYEGAKIVADEVRRGIEALPTNDVRSAKKGAMVRGVTPEQKAGLLSGLGIASMRIDGSFINVKIGMDGYNAVKTKSFPNGQPNALIARSVESGSSFRAKTPFIAPAVARSKGAAEAKMAQVYEEETKKIMGD